MRNLRPASQFVRTAATALLVVASSVACGFAQAPATAPAKAQSAPIVVAIANERTEPVYRRGEPVKFLITVSQDGKPLAGEQVVEYRVTNDGLAPPIAEGKLNVVGGRAEVTSKLDVPGFLNCRVVLSGPGVSPKSESAAAAVDPTEIRPSLPPPDDFDAFWNEQKSLLAAIPLNVRLTSVTSPVSGVACFDLQADGVNGPLSAYVAMPQGAKPGSLPAIVIPHGAGVRGSGLGSAAKWAQTGFLALDFNANGLPNGKPDKFYSDLSNGELRQYYLKGRESRETAFFRTLFLRVVRALDAVTAQKEWNGKTLVVHGVSQGGGQAIAAAGLDPRVTLFCAFVPAICDHTGSAAGRVNGWPKLVPLDPKTGKADEKILQTSRYFDAVNFATRAKAPAVFTVGFVDGVCPPSSVYAAYNAVPGEKQMIHLPRTGHATTPESNDAVLKAVLKHAKSQSQKQ
jgi:cephalosporin-C deacetylase